MEKRMGVLRFKPAKEGKKIVSDTWITAKVKSRILFDKETEFHVWPVRGEEYCLSFNPVPS